MYTSLLPCDARVVDIFILFKHVFVNAVASVQYRALANKATDTFYKLSNTRAQIQAYVFCVIRASVPKLTLDESFEQKNEITKAVEEELEKIPPGPLPSTPFVQGPELAQGNQSE
ncbi:hypothetical protein CDL15_Pgr014736 [Punica granatum]|uniref:Uncharacterized protein n=1 Tax=Punica granatum TaxID=22663 RepID=A0A218XZJ1_PUNGR|nr:hypothetical protein CDL15_Pgr014736 [Punica granatum]